MARPHICHNIGKAPINNSNTLILTSIVSCAFTLAPAQYFAFTSAPGLPKRYTDEDLQRAIKLALELFVKGQKHGQL